MTKRSRILVKCRLQLISLIKATEEMETKEKSLFPRAIRYAHDQIQSCPGDYFTSTLAEVADLQAAIAREQERFRMIRMLSLDLIEDVRSARQRYVLRQYYTEKHLIDVNGAKSWTWYTLEDIANEMGTNVDTVKKIKRRGILGIDRPPIMVYFGSR